MQNSKIFLKTSPSLQKWKKKNKKSKINGLRISLQTVINQNPKNRATNNTR